MSASVFLCSIPSEAEEGISYTGLGIAVVSCHVGAGDQTLVLWKSSSALILWAMASISRDEFYIFM